MPHFKARNITNLSNIRTFKDELFSFSEPFLEKNKQLVMVTAKHQSPFLIQILYQDGKLLFKGEKSTKPAASVLKLALNALKQNLNGEILSHNLSFKTDPGALAKRKNAFFIEHFESSFFKDFVLEIGFGSGRNLLLEAKEQKDTLFLGVELHAPSIAQILRQIELQNLSNLYILKGDSKQVLKTLLPNSCSKIILHFPVPWRKSPTKKVFSADFLQSALRVLKKEGFLHLRTDDFLYFKEAFLLVSQTQDLEFSARKNISHSIISKYEARWQKQQKDIFDLIIKPARNCDQNAGWNKVQKDGLKNKPDMHQSFSELQNQSFMTPFFVKNAFCFPNLELSYEKLQSLKNTKFLSENILVAIKSCFVNEGRALLGVVLGSILNNSFKFIEIGSSASNLDLVFSKDCAKRPVNCWIKYLREPFLYKENILAHQKLIAILRD